MIFDCFWIFPLGYKNISEIISPRILAYIVFRDCYNHSIWLISDRYFINPPSFYQRTIFFSPWYLNWPGSQPALTWSWSDRIWSRLLRWTLLSARPALWLQVQRCSAGSRWCRHNPPVCWQLQTEWREKPLLQSDDVEKKQRNHVCKRVHHHSLTHKAFISPETLLTSTLWHNSIVAFMPIWNWAICWRSQVCEIDYYCCWQQYKHAEDGRYKINSSMRSKS